MNEILTYVTPTLGIIGAVVGAASVWWGVKGRITVLELKVKNLEENSDNLSALSRSVIRLEEQMKSMSTQLSDLRDYFKANK